MSFQNQQPSNFYILAVEATSVLSTGQPEQEALLKQSPVIEKYFRIIYQKVYAAHQFRIKYIYDLAS